MDNLTLFFLAFGLSNKNPFLDQLMIFGAEYVIYITLALMFILAFKSGTKEKKAFLLAIFSLPVVVILIKIIHLFIFEPRPFLTFDISPIIAHDTSSSFPSRHASLMAAFALAYIIYKPRWGLVFLLLMLWVGVARIYVGVHYPLDILGGVIVGFLSVLLTRQMIKILKGRLMLR